MQLLSALSRLLTILSIVGLVIGGAAPAAAGPMSTLVMTMAEGMPPCDDMAPDCGGMMKSCPFQIVCAAKCPQATLAAATIPFPSVRRAADMPGDFRGVSSLTHAPPARPPKA